MNSEDQRLYVEMLELVFKSEGKKKMSVGKVLKKASSRALTAKPETDKRTHKAQLTCFIAENSKTGVLQFDGGKLIWDANTAKQLLGGKALQSSDFTGTKSASHVQKKRKIDQQLLSGKASSKPISQAANMRKAAQLDVANKPAKASSPVKGPPSGKKHTKEELPSVSKRRRASLDAEAKPRNAAVETQDQNEARRGTKETGRDAKRAKQSHGDPEGKPAQSNLTERDNVSDEERVHGTYTHNWNDFKTRTDIKHGRFGKAEKEALKAAAEEFARERGRDDKDLSWLFESEGKGKFKRGENPWTTITQRALPHRSVRAVYNHALRLLQPQAARRLWTKEEDDRLLEWVESNGKKWKAISDELHRLPSSCRDRYRELSTTTDERALGQWSAEECQRMQDAVEEYMEAHKAAASRKAAELSFDDLDTEANGMPTPEKGSDHRVILDDIDWSWVASKVRTRTRGQCNTKWYRTMSPSMVSTGEWGLGDDRRLLKGILATEAAFHSQVPWDDVVPSRTAKQSKRRWALMLKRVPDVAEKSFWQQVIYLADKFAPGLREKVAKLRSEEGGPRLI